MSKIDLEEYAEQLEAMDDIELFGAEDLEKIMEEGRQEFIEDVENKTPEELFGESNWEEIRQDRIDHLLVDAENKNAEEQEEKEEEE